MLISESLATPRIKLATSGVLLSVSGAASALYAPVAASWVALICGLCLLGSLIFLKD